MLTVLIFVTLCIGVSLGARNPTFTGEKFGSKESPEARNPLLQPFASWSIWNLPVGRGAQYVSANLNISSNTMIEADPDVLLLDSTQPLTPYYFSSAAWTHASRCLPTNESGSPKVMLTAPYPRQFVIASDGNNYAGAILLGDKRTIKQTQPLCHCTTGGAVTTYANFLDADLYGDGTYGAHGGSQLSSIGGTIRLGEFLPDGNGVVQPVRHALKSNLWAARNYYRNGNDHSSCFRWPATNCDGYWNDGKPDAYGGKNPTVRPGALLAISTSVDINSLGLKTTPGKALAWTLQNYGTYLVDDSYWDSIALETELGPQGDYQEAFQQAWNMDFRSKDNAWGIDVQIIFAHISSVNNWDSNLYNSVKQSNGNMGSGGGAPLQPWADAINPPN